MKKGVSSLIAWVLLIGFAVTLAVFVSRWSLQQAQKSTSGVEDMVMGDIQCSDVAISGFCENGKIKIKNRGTLNIIGFRKDGKETMFEDDPLKPGGIAYPTGVYKGSFVPIIEIEGKKVLCASQKQDFECPQS